MLKFLSSDGVESLLVGQILHVRGLNFLGLDFAIGQKKLVELFTTDQPELFEVFGEVLFEFGVYLQPPVILLVAFVGLQQLFDQAVHVLDLELREAVVPVL